MANAFIYGYILILLSTACHSLKIPNNQEFDFACQYDRSKSSLYIYHGYREEHVKTCLRTYTSARSLTIAHSKLKIIPDYLNILDGLVQLDLSNNEIYYVDFNTNALAGICKILKSINLDFNNIQTLLPGRLDCLQSLEQLYIANNNLTTIKNGTFSVKLNALNYIHLVNNSLTELDSSLISKVLLSNKANICINASWNRIKVATNSVNITIENISPSNTVGIILVHNNITTVDMEYYAKIFHVTSPLQLYRLWNSGFDARFNPFICDCSLYPLAQALRMFYHMDRDNPVFSITCGFPVNLYGTMVRKVPLNQFNCSVTQDCPETCSCTKTIAINLTTVTCSDQYPQHDLPQKCPEANKIDLFIRSGNLSRISPTKCLTNVEVLDVSQSAVKDIDPLIVDALQGRSNRRVYVHDNDLESIPKRFESFEFSKGQILEIHGNPFNCDCNLRWIKKWLQSHTEYIPYQDKIMCGSGLGKGKPIVEVPDNKFVCQTNLSDYDILAIAVGSFFVLILLTSFTVFSIKTIQVFMIHHFDVCKYCCRRKACRRMKYDIFIPHSCDDDDIVNKIVNYLERMKEPYKVCIGERNFAAGKTITENILTAIESSQTTLLVISNNFLRSAWCNMEFREAHMRFLKDRTIRMVLILLEDLNTSLVYEELKFYMDTHVYIKYNDKQFWAKLLQSLPIMIPNNNVDETSPLISD